MALQLLSTSPVMVLSAGRNCVEAALLTRASISSLVFELVNGGNRLGVNSYLKKVCPVLGSAALMAR